MWCDTWYCRGEGVSSDAMLFGNGLMESLGYEEVHVSLEAWRDDPASCDRLVKQKYPYAWGLIVPFTDVVYAAKEWLREAPLVAWMSDDTWRYESFGKLWKGTADLIATTSPEAAVRYGPKGLLTNWACRPEWAKWQPRKKAAGASFQGQLYGDRKARLEAIAYAHDRPIRAIDTAESQQAPADYFKFLGASEFAICLTGSSRGTPQMKSRLFEPQLVGSILITEPVETLANWWEPGKECLVADSPAAFHGEMTRLLADSARLQVMKAAALRRALAEHTYQHRVGSILQRLGLQADPAVH